MEYKLAEEYLLEIIKRAFVDGFIQGTAQNIGTTNALEKAKEYAKFMLGNSPIRQSQAEEQQKI